MAAAGRLYRRANGRCGLQKKQIDHHHSKKSGNNERGKKNRPQAIKKVACPPVYNLPEGLQYVIILFTTPPVACSAAAL